MRLSDLHPAPGARTRRTRVGRGHGSGHVKTSGRGQKGQKARTGAHVPAYFEGGQNRFSQRMPYVGGFKNPFKKHYALVHLYQLGMFEAGSAVDAESLATKGVLRPSEAKGMVKILSDGEVNRALSFRVHKVTERARQKIEAAGGSISIIEIPRPKQTKRAPKTAESAGAAPTSVATPTA